MMTRSLAFLCIIFFLGCQKDSSPSADDPVFRQTTIKSVRVTTFNLKWYGLKRNGGFEFRNPYIKRFIDQELSQSDVIFFTEIVDWHMLGRMLGSQWSCQDDEFKDGYRNQQHVVLCYKNSKFRIEAYDEDHMIPEVAMKRPGSLRTGLRPALHTQLCSLQGDCFLQIIGLHLKASKSWHRRAQQVRFIRDELAQQPNPLPTLVIGDMNSFRKERKNCTKTSICLDDQADPATCEVDPVLKFECSEDDITVLNSILKEAHGRTYRSVTLGIPTYSSGQWGLDYDHIILTPEVQARNIKAYSACENNIDPNSIFIPYKSTFRKYFSDHCPVSATLTFGETP